MKKLLAFILIITLTLALAACGGGETNDQDNNKDQKTESSASGNAEGEGDGNENTSHTHSNAAAELLTPEEIYALVSGTTSVRLVLSANFPGVLTMNTVVERTGEVYRVSANLARKEGVESSETFLYRDGEAYYQIAKDENGQWFKSETSEISLESLGLGSLAPLFDSKNYGQPDENGRYTMADTFVFDFQNVAFGNGSLEQKNGSYTVTMTGSMDGTEGTMQVIVDAVDSTTVTLPQVAE